MSVNLQLPHGAFRLIENDKEKDYDGGRIVLIADNGDQAKTSENPKGDKLMKANIQSVTVIINYTSDDPMADWPAVRQEIAQRRFNLHIWEQPMEPPPAPPVVKPA